MLTIVAMLGFAGVAYAAGNHAGAKVVPASRDFAGKKASVVANGDGPEIVAHAAVHSGGGPLAPPSNDDCAGAIVIPSGSLPVLTAPVDITEATPVSDGNGGGEEGILTCGTIERTVWYTFTPTTSGQYTFSTCTVNAPGDTLLDTVIGVFDSTGGSCPQAAQLACNDTGSCAIAGTDDKSKASAVLTAGNTYFVVAGHWAGVAAGSNDPIGPGNDTIQIQVDISPAPSNDTCSSPKPLTLDRIIFGTTAAATNDYRSPAACFLGPGQIASSSNGIDVVFSFVPPDSDSYSFRYVQDDAAASLRNQSPVLYLTDNCPPPNNAVAVTGCIAAANRMNDQTTGNGNRSEEIDCVPLTGGTPYYLFFDDRFTANAGGDLAMEVTRCKREVEPNDTPATATVYAPNSSCFMEGGATGALGSGPAADIDFYDLGAPPAGSKIFVGVDSAASTTSDYELRVTSATDTYGYDDNDGSSWVGSNAPIVAGPIAPGGEMYARVNGKTVNTGMQPYLLFARVETGAPTLERLPDPDPSGPTTVASLYFNAVHLSGSGYIKGTMNTLNDNDCFAFVAHTGDNIVFFADNNPDRAGGTITNVWPLFRTLDGNPTPARTRFVGQVVRNIGEPGPGAGLTAVTPSTTSNFAHYRARYDGLYLFCYVTTQDVNSTDNPAAGAYPLPYAGDITVNCAPPAAPEAADLSITKTGPAGPVRTGDLLSYTITITNNSATAIAQYVRLVDNLPAGLNYIGISVNDTWAGQNTGVSSLPTPGTANAPIDLTNWSLGPGQSIVYTLDVQVANCIGSGQTIQNTATVSADNADAITGNNSASWTFTTSEDGSCNTLLCDASGCIVDACQINDHCVSGACVSDAVNCDDQSVCTADSCDSAWVDGPTDHSPCINDSSQLGDLCFDGNDCTHDGCNPVTFCEFLSLPQGTPCNDFLNCTFNDVCDGALTCAGTSVCDDGLPCTDDFADEANSCFCYNTISYPGTACNDGNACTLGTTCDGVDGGVANCNNPTGSLNCDDNNPCTDDSCDPLLGCVHTNNTASCSDGNACTVGDTCGGGQCNSGAPLVCNDGNGCTDDTCDTGSGCVYTNNSAPCNDGDACTTNDTCSGGSCQGGAALVCNDGNACTTDTCVSPGGCVYTNNTNPCSDGNACTVGDTCGGGSCNPGAPVVCSASDQCHTAGTCDPGSGLCSNPAKPDGTACNDNSLCTTNDKCTGGVCGGTSHLNEPHPRTVGYWQGLCWGWHSGDALTTADAQCVADTTQTFDTHTVSELCAILNRREGGDDHGDDHGGWGGNNGHNTYCDKARAELVALALNRCRARVCDAQQIDSDCAGSTSTTVGQSFTIVDSTLVNATSATVCKGARCLAREINRGRAFIIDDVHCDRDDHHHHGGMNCHWSVPRYNDDTQAPRAYDIFRRAHGAGAFTKVATVSTPSYYVEDPDSNYDYDIVPVE